MHEAENKNACVWCVFNTWCMLINIKITFKTVAYIDSNVGAKQLF